MCVFEKAAKDAGSSTLITYGSKKTRRECQESTYGKINRAQQFYDVLWTLIGPTAFLNAVVNALLSSYFFPITKDTPWFPTATEFFIHLLLLTIIGDFALYWGHRIQHMNKFLWDHCHSYHHTIDTPTALSTAAIESTDGTIQGGLSIVFGGVLLAPHPITYYAYIFIRLMDNVMNHCGIRTHALVRGVMGGDSSVALMVARAMALLTFKGAHPVRAGVEHHDFHHKYSNYTQNAKNFGEFFTVWDHVFGTFSKASSPKAL